MAVAQQRQHGQPRPVLLLLLLLLPGRAAAGAAGAPLVQAEVAEAGQARQLCSPGDGRLSIDVQPREARGEAEDAADSWLAHNVGA